MRETPALLCLECLEQKGLGKKQVEHRGKGSRAKQPTAGLRGCGLPRAKLEVPRGNICIDCVAIEKGGDEG